jgi:hypothetical protein
MTENTDTSTDASPSISTRLVRALPIRGVALALVVLVLFFGPAAAQSPGEAFCETDVAHPAS